MNINTMTGLVHIFQYASPKGCYHTPRVIEPGLEEIEVIVAGKGDFLVDDEFTEAGPGSMLWYGPGEVVEVTSHEREPYNTIVFVYTSTRNGRPLPMISHWRDPLACGSFCTEMLQAFQQGTRSVLLAQTSYSRLLWEGEQGLREIAPTEPEAVSRAATYIASRYLDPSLQVEEVAAAARISVPHLHALLKEHRGCAPFQMILQRRLERACLLLRSTDLPIKTVALESGFREANHFCRIFRKHQSQSPGVYRSTSRLCSGIHHARR